MVLKLFRPEGWAKQHPKTKRAVLANVPSFRVFGGPGISKIIAFFCQGSAFGWNLSTGKHLPKPPFCKPSILSLLGHEILSERSSPLKRSLKTERNVPNPSSASKLKPKTKTIDQSQGNGKKGAIKTRISWTQFWPSHTNSLHSAGYTCTYTSPTSPWPMLASCNYSLKQSPSWWGLCNYECYVYNCGQTIRSSSERRRLSTQKKITYTEKYVGELISRNISYFLLICPRSEFISEICNFRCLKHGPTELHVWLSGELICSTTRNKII